MKYIIVLLLIFGLVSVCYADRVCLEKSTGKLIEYQSGDAPLGTLTQNAINSGYIANNITEKYVNAIEWESIRQKWIVQPALQAQQNKANATAIQVTALQKKLNLTEQDWNNLKQVLTK